MPFALRDVGMNMELHQRQLEAIRRLVGFLAYALHNGEREEAERIRAELTIFEEGL